MIDVNETINMRKDFYNTFKEKFIKNGYGETGVFNNKKGHEMVLCTLRMHIKDFDKEYELLTFENVNKKGEIIQYVKSIKRGQMIPLSEFIGKR